MTSLWRWLVLAICIIAIAFGSFYAGRHSAPAPNAAGDTSSDSTQPDSQPAETAATALVETVPLVRKSISQTLVAYGTVVAQPGEVKISSVPFESRVLHIRVTAGQPVSVGTELLTIEPSADARLQLRQAQSAVDQADAALKQAQQRFSEKLATNQELTQAQQALQNAQLNLQSLQSRGIGSQTTLHAELEGEIAKVDVQEGQIVAAGAPMIELIAANRIEVRFGIEPDDASKLQPGQAVRITSVSANASGSAKGVMRLVTHTINPDTRLIDAFASLPEGAGFMLSDYVRGEVAVESKDGLVVPKSAVLPGDDDQQTMFTVRDGKAVKHVVVVGLQSGDEIEVTADGLKEGDSVVTVGNYELEDGMAVAQGNAQ
jgi:membrane fusion protein (multidrug efflux system)